MRETIEYSLQKKRAREDHLPKIRKLLTEFYNMEELRRLCFDLGINHENFPQTIESFVRELLIYANRHNKLNELIIEAQQINSTPPWSEIRRSLAV